MVAVGNPFAPDRFAPRDLLSRRFVMATCCAVALGLPFVISQGHDPVLREAIIRPRPDTGELADSEPSQTSPTEPALALVPVTSRSLPMWQPRRPGQPVPTSSQPVPVPPIADVTTTTTTQRSRSPVPTASAGHHDHEMRRPPKPRLPSRLSRPNHPCRLAHHESPDIVADDRCGTTHNDAAAAPAADDDNRAGHDDHTSTAGHDDDRPRTTAVADLPDLPDLPDRIPPTRCHLRPDPRHAWVTRRLMAGAPHAGRNRQTLVEAGAIDPCSPKRAALVPGVVSGPRTVEMH